MEGRRTSHKGVPQGTSPDPLQFKLYHQVHENLPLRFRYCWTKLRLFIRWFIERLVHLVSPIGHREGELVGVLLFLAGVDVLDAARHQIGLSEGADPGAWRERRGNRSQLVEL